jgi:hypothetical protein
MRIPWPFPATGGHSHWQGTHPLGEGTASPYPSLGLSAGTEDQRPEDDSHPLTLSLATAESSRALDKGWLL